MTLIYLASPYSHRDCQVRLKRWHLACDNTGHLMNAGFAVYSPIAQNHPVANWHKLPTDWAFWKEQCTLFISRCDELYVLCIDGWKESVGVQAEIEIAKQLNKPIQYIEPA